MREIKFRAFNPTTKNMWWFDLMWGNMHHVGSGWIGMLETPDRNRNTPNGRDDRTQVDPYDCEIMQFTGLLDKNGVECYWDDWVTDGINPKFLVTEDYHLLARLSEIEFEIIGNKYES